MGVVKEIINSLDNLFKAIPVIEDDRPLWEGVRRLKTKEMKKDLKEMDIEELQKLTDNLRTMSWRLGQVKSEVKVILFKKQRGY